MRNNLILVSLFLALLGSGFASIAQSPSLKDISFKNYTPAAGLPSDFIEEITQDKYGFLWLGTHNGLVRYDGSHFTLYQHNPQDSTSLSVNDVRSITADLTGKCWIASRKGLSYFDYARNAFYQKNLFAGRSIHWASGATTDSAGMLWFLSNAGVCRLDCRSGTELLIPLPGSSHTAYTENIFFCTAPGTVWLFDSANLFRLEGSARKFQAVPIDPVIYSRLAQGIFAVYETREALWVASYAGFYRYGLHDHQLTKIPFAYNGSNDPNISISGFDLCPRLTGDSVLWCSTPYQGLVLFNLNSRRFTGRFLQDPYDVTSIGSSLCYKTFLDHAGILWIAQFNGLSKLDWQAQRIKSYRIREMVDSNRLMPIRKMLRASLHPDRFWLLTWNFGALYYDRTTNRVIRQFKKTGGSHPVDISALYDGILDLKKRLWIGSEQGLCYFDSTIGQMTNCPPEELPAGRPLVVLRILPAGGGQLLLGTENGLWLFSPAKRKYKPYPFAAGSDSSIQQLPVYAICYDRKGRLYAGTRHGLYVIDTLTHKCRALPRTARATGDDFNIHYIWGLDVDSGNRVWVTTRGGGLYNYDPAARKYHDYSVGRGLTTEELRDVFVDSLQRIWMSSFEGIFMLDPLGGYFTHYGPEDGLDNLNISLGRWTILDNKIYSGSPGAFSIINPYTKTIIQDLVNVSIISLRTDIRIQYFNPDSTSSHSQTLSSSETNVTIAFAAPVFSGIEKNHLVYRLTGVDKDWQDATDLGSANYHNLPPGRYIFQVKANNRADHEPALIASLSLNIRPPFWKTRWFWIALIVTAGAITWIAVARRIKTIRQSTALLQQQAVVKQQLAEMEMMALRSQMNPHFIFNCMNIMDALVRENRREEAQQFIQQFSKLLRLVLENSSHPLVSLRFEMEALTLYINLEVIRNNRAFQYSLTVDQELTEKNYFLPPMLLQPYVENAIVHGLRPRIQPGGRLTISIRSVDGQVLVFIEDNGIGRAESRALNQKNRMSHQPVALRLTAKRIELLRHTFGAGISVTVDDLQPGTLVKLTLPTTFTFDQKS